MTNEELVKILPNLNILREAAQIIDKRIKEDIMLRNDMNESIRLAELVTEVYEGVAIRITPDGYIYAVISNGRGADVYKAVGKHPGFGLRIRAYGDLGGEFMGCGWTNEEAFIAAKNWVAKGIRPERKN